jgi:DNA-directed RNA polymerase subunit RPC12/RpoP
MSEFNYACPVCHQHLKCPTSQAGSVMKCPTCYQRIVAPQAPSAADGNLVFTGHRYVERKTTSLPTTSPTSSAAATTGDSVAGADPGQKMPVGLIVVIGLVVVALAGAGWLIASGKFAFSKAPLKHGAVGLGSWGTAVEYDNLVVTKGTKVLYQSNFATGTSGWRFGAGTWSSEGGFLRQAATTKNTQFQAIIGDANWGDYTLSVRARKLSGREGFLIYFNVLDEKNFTCWNIGGLGNTKDSIDKCVAGNSSYLSNVVPGHVNVGEWYDLRVELNGLRMRCYLNNALIHDQTYPAPNP